jgi:hypothetical protein
MPGAGHVKPMMSSSLQVAPGVGRSQGRPRNGHKLNSTTTWYTLLVLIYRRSTALNDKHPWRLCRYNDLKVGRGEFNYGFWGQECGPVKDPTPGRLHKYMEDAISVNTGIA